jgi:hypothetical protein
MRVRPTTYVLLMLATLTAVGSNDQTLMAVAPPVPLARCVAVLSGPTATAAAPPKGVATRPIGQVRHFDRANITVSAGTTVDGAIQVEAAGGDLSFRKRVQADGRYTMEIEAPRDKVSIGVTENAITVTRGRKTITITPEASQRQADDLRRMLADSRAIDLLRNAGAELEASGDDSAASTPVVLADALVGTLTGDVGASRRAARRLSEKARAQLRPVGRPNTCYYQWEQTILFAYMELEECVIVSGIWPVWCHVRWTMQAESAWFSLISCSGFGF